MVEAQTSDRPFRNPKVITPNDGSDNIRADARGLIVLAAGNLSVTDGNGETLPFVGLAAGTTLPIETLRRVRATGTTATVADGL